MTDETKTPLEIAREVWPGLEWAVHSSTDVWTRIDAPLLGSTITIAGSGPLWDIRPLVEGAPDLRTALLEAKRVTAAKLREALAMCEDADEGRADDPLIRPPGHVDALPSRAATPEPDPVTGEGDVWAEIIARLEDGPLKDACIARRAMGVEKYGQPLQRGDGRDHAIDEAQEHLDAAAYRAARAGAEDPAVMASLHRAAECLGIEEVYPVPVAFHPNGEAVLMLTGRPEDEVWAVVANDIEQVIELAPDSLWRARGKAQTCILYCRRRRQLVREPAADIRRTLEMLAERAGGGK